MSSAKPARGRPKGTGLDDRAILQSVIQMVEANPNLKPTTAIKSIGVTDPSAIRRLRDKYHLVHGQAGDAASTRRPTDAVRVVQPARAMALKSVSEPVRTAPRQVKQIAPPRQTGKSPAMPEAIETPVVRPLTARPSTDWFSVWAELGLQTMAVSLNTQLLIYDQVLRSPPVTAALGGHAVLTGFAAAWCATSPASSKTVH
ncbi:MAG: hypothetical protein ABL894_14145 [Hyphomicrobium sp.]